MKSKFLNVFWKVNAIRWRDVKIILRGSWEVSRRGIRLHWWLPLLLSPVRCLECPTSWLRRNTESQRLQQQWTGHNRPSCRKCPENRTVSRWTSQQPGFEGDKNWSRGRIIQGYSKWLSGFWQLVIHNTLQIGVYVFFFFYLIEQHSKFLLRTL